MAFFLNYSNNSPWFLIYLFVIAYILWVDSDGKFYIIFGVVATLIITGMFFFIHSSDEISITEFYPELMIIISLWLVIYFISRNKNILFRETREKERLNAIFENATEGIIMVNQAGKIIMINRYVEELFRYAREELIGQQIEKLIPERFTKAHLQHRHEYHKDPRNRPMGSGMELFARRKDDTEFPVEIGLGYYKIQEEVIVIAFISNISARKKAEDQLQQLNIKLESKVTERTADLKKALKNLEENNQYLKKIEKELLQALEKERDLGELKSRFVTTASHEFRTPLSTILSSVFLLENFEDQQLLDTKDIHLARIRRSVNNMTSILNDFLSLSKLEEGRVKASYAEIDIRSCMEEIIDEMEALKKTGQRLIYHHSGTNAPRMIDKQFLRNIIINLISNSIKFSGPEGKIELESKNEEDQLEIIVRDNGLGIPKEEMKHLFNRFFRAKNVLNIEGTGLGLSIVQKYVELMRGSIRVESKIDVGTTFSISIPFVNEAENTINKIRHLDNQ